MKRFYYNRQDNDRYAIFDGHRSNGDPIGWAVDVTTAEMIVQSLNRYWEKIHEA